VKKRQKKILRVAVLVETSTDWGRQIVEGIGNYSRSNGPWNCFVEPHGLGESIIKLPEDWRPDGIVARVHTQEVYEYLAESKIPVVNVSGTKIASADWPRVSIDEPGCVHMALEYLLGLGLRRFAYYGDPTLGYYAEQRTSTYSKIVRGEGYDCAVYNPSAEILSSPSWGGLQRDRARWLRSLPKPVGIITWGAIQARCVSDSCSLAGIRIPGDAAIIGIDSDVLVSTMARPALSSVRLSSRQQGFQAAAMLDALLRGAEPAEKEQYIAPLGIVPRESTNMLAIADGDVRKALRYIRENSCRNISVSDVAKHSSMSRRSMERKFAEWLGYTPASEIRRVKLECVRHLLTDTSLPIGEIALSCGWPHVEHLIPTFRKVFDMTPLQYRKQVEAR